jgi:hypothetical protein
MNNNKKMPLSQSELTGWITFSPIDMGMRLQGGRPASESQRSGVCICIGDEVTSPLRMFLGYWSMTETEAEEIEELEWGGSE